MSDIKIAGKFNCIAADKVLADATQISVQPDSSESDVSNVQTAIQDLWTNANDLWQDASLLDPSKATAVIGSESVDLNDFVTPGNYYCTSNAQDIKNIPQKATFVLKIERIFPLDSEDQKKFDAATTASDKLKYCGYIIQTFKTVLNQVYCRTTKWNGADNKKTFEWQSWKWLSPDCSALYDPTSQTAIINVDQGTVSNGVKYRQILPSGVDTIHSGGITLGNKNYPFYNFYSRFIYTSSSDEASPTSSDIVQLPCFTIKNSSGTTLNEYTLYNIIIQL